MTSMPSALPLSSLVNSEAVPSVFRSRCFRSELAGQVQVRGQRLAFAVGDFEVTSFHARSTG